MKLKHILSLAVAASVLGAYAAAPTYAADEGATIWDFTQIYQAQTTFAEANPVSYNGLAIYGNASSAEDYLSPNAGLRWNGKASGRYIEFTPAEDGSIELKGVCYIYNSDPKLRLEDKNVSSTYTDFTFTGGSSSVYVDSTNSIEVTGGHRYQIYPSNTGASIRSMVFTPKPEEALPEGVDYSVTAKAAGTETVVDTSRLDKGDNVSGYLVTTAANRTEKTSVTAAKGNSVTVTADAGDDIEIAPIYEYNETQAYGNGITLADTFPNGRYNITVTNGSTSHFDLYVNGYMAANNIDETGGDGRFVSTGSTYTAHDVRVESKTHKITITTADSANSLSYVKVVKSPSIVTSKKKIFITGDSLVCNYYGGNTENYLGTTQTGWGQALSSFIDTDKYEIVNLANSGYWAERLRTTAFPGIIYNAVEGDIFLLESGVNDYWNPAGKGTSAGLDSDRTTMKSTVTKMVEGAKAASLPIILVTPNAQPSRHDTTNCFSDVMKEVAGEQNVSCVDLAALSHTLVYELYGSNGESEEAVTANMKANLGVNKDGTHSSYLGAMKYASIVGTELYKLGYTDMFTDYEYTKNDTLGQSIICKVDKSAEATPMPTAVPTPTPEPATPSADEKGVITWDFESAPSEINYTEKTSFYLKSGMTVDSTASAYQNVNDLLYVQDFTSSDYINSTKGLHINGSDRYINYWPSADGTLHIYGIKKVYSGDTTLTAYDKGTNGSSNNNAVVYYTSGNMVTSGTSYTMSSTSENISISCTAGHRYQITGSSGFEITKIEFVPTAAKAYVFDVTDWNSKSLYIEASKGSVTDTKSIALSETTNVAGEGSISLAVIITDVPADVTIKSIYVQ